MADDVQLTDLLVIQRYSLAVRSTTAGREELLAALQADVDWLRDGQAVPATAQVPAEVAPEEPAPATSAPRRVSVPARAPRATAAKATVATRPDAVKAPAARTATRAPGVRSPRA